MGTTERAAAKAGSTAGLPDQSGPPTGTRRADIAATILLVVIASIMLSWVALFNGAPLVFSDTIAYATSALLGAIPGFFSAWYGIFILPLHQGVTLWPAVFVQGAMIGHLLYLVVRCVAHGTIGRLQILLIVVYLCFFSGLPWITGEILPDVFTPVVLLGIFLLAFCSNHLGRAEVVYVAVLTAVGIAVHLSHVPIALGLMLLAIALQRVFAPAEFTVRRWAVLASVFAIGVGSLLGITWYNSRTLALAPHGNVFLMAKWISDGPALSYLVRSCPTMEYSLCAYVDEMEGLSHEDLKWDENSPFHKVGSFDQLEAEAHQIVLGTLRAYPLEILQRAARDAGRQLLRFKAAEGLTDYNAKFVAYHLGSVFAPGVGTSIAQSRQAEDQLFPAEFHPLHLVGLALGAGLCVWAMIIARRRNLPPELVALQVFVAAGILCNAIVTGALSGPYDRYLARVIWLILFVGLVSLAYALRNRECRHAVSNEPA